MNNDELTARWEEINDSIQGLATEDERTAAYTELARIDEVRFA